MNSRNRPPPNVPPHNCSLAHYSIKTRTTIIKNNTKMKNLSCLLHCWLYSLHSRLLEMPQLWLTNRWNLLLSQKAFHPEHTKPSPYFRPLEPMTGFPSKGICFGPLIFKHLSLSFSPSLFKICLVGNAYSANSTKNADKKKTTENNTVGEWLMWAFSHRWFCLHFHTAVTSEARTMVGSLPWCLRAHKLFTQTWNGEFEV